MRDAIILVLLFSLSALAPSVQADGFNNVPNYFLEDLTEFSGFSLADYWEVNVSISEEGLHFDEFQTSFDMLSVLENGGNIRLNLNHLGLNSTMSSSRSPSSNSCDNQNSNGMRMYVIQNSTSHLKGALSFNWNGQFLEYDFYLIGLRNAIDPYIGFQLLIEERVNFTSVTDLGYFNPPFSTHFDPIDLDNKAWNSSLVVKGYSYPLYRIRASYDGESPTIICREISKADVIARGMLGFSVGIVDMKQDLVMLPLANINWVCDRNRAGIPDIMALEVTPSAYSPKQPNEYDSIGLFFSDLDNQSVSGPNVPQIACGFYNNDEKGFWVNHSKFTPVHTNGNHGKGEITGWHAQVILHEIMHTLMSSHADAELGEKHASRPSDPCPARRYDPDNDDEETEGSFAGGATGVIYSSSNNFTSLMTNEATDYHCWGQIPFGSSISTDFMKVVTGSLPFAIVDVDITQYVFATGNTGQPFLIPRQLIIPNIWCMPSVYCTPSTNESFLVEFDFHHIGFESFEYGIKGDVSTTSLPPLSYSSIIGGSCTYTAPPQGAIIQNFTAPQFDYYSNGNSFHAKGCSSSSNNSLTLQTIPIANFQAYYITFFAESLLGVTYYGPDIYIVT